MTVRATQYAVATVQSLYYFLNRTSYIASGSGFYTTTTLKSRYPNLDIILGFPNSLNEIKLPTLALVQDVSIPEADTFDSQYQERVISFHIDGFAGGTQSEARNRLQRDQMREDIRYFLTDIDYIDLYGIKSDGTIDTDTAAISDVEIMNVQDENIPPTGIMAVDKYRFRVSFEVGLVRDVQD